MIKNKKILITGATGFIGANITRSFLKEGAKVSIFTRKTSNKWRIEDILGSVTEYSVDLLDRDKLKKVIMIATPDIIVHNAVYGGYPWQNDEEKIRKTNIVGTENLLTSCAEIGFELFINTGSSSEYGIKDGPISEEHMAKPINAYGESNAQVTSFCRDLALKEELAIVTLRLFSPYGYFEERRRLIPSVIISCLKNKNPKVSSPDSVRDFIFIEDVANAYVKIVENRDIVGGQIFNVGYGKQHSVGQVVEKIIELTGSEVRPRWGSIANPRVEPKMWQADISKIKRLLSWEPQHDLAQGLRTTIDWFKKNLSLYEEGGL